MHLLYQLYSFPKWSKYKEEKIIIILVGYKEDKCY